MSLNVWQRAWNRVLGRPYNYGEEVPVKPTKVVTSTILPTDVYLGLVYGDSVAEIERNAFQAAGNALSGVDYRGLEVRISSLSDGSSTSKYTTLVNVRVTY